MLDDIDVFRLTGARMRYLAERQNVLAQNVANADTPHYRARDVRPFTFESALLRGAGGATPLHLATTNTSHITPGRNGSSVVADRASSYSEDPDGNTVTLEEQMVKQADVAKSYDMATAVYRHSAALFRAAAGGH
jgi:flagellar basal-body rod protein FlgB